MALSIDEHAALKGRYIHIQERIKRACDRVKRDHREVVLLGASKKQPLSLIQELDHIAAARGENIRFGENYVQELAEKRSSIATIAKWHFIGRLQSNKIRTLLPWCDCLESVSSMSIATKLEKELAGSAKALSVFIQVNISDDPNKGGVSKQEVLNLFRSISEECSFVMPIGIMTITEAYRDESEVRNAYRGMRELREEISSAFKNVSLELSMGMSDDFEIAIEEGATEVRIGTLLFGKRENL